MNLLTCSEIYSTKPFNKNKLMPYQFKSITLETTHFIFYIWFIHERLIFPPKKALKVKNWKKPQNQKSYPLLYRLQCNVHKGEVLFLSLLKLNFKNWVIKNTEENQAVYDKLPN